MNNWRYICEDKVSASHGLAADEYLLSTHISNDNEFLASLKLYTYKNYCTLAGRFQDINAEIDIEVCDEVGFQYGRRMTGGGAIIMGQDQLGICLATSSNAFPWKHFRELYTLFSQPIVNMLKELGINAQFRSKNDLEVNGKKIAGLGVYISSESTIQFHASLLVDLDISQMLKVLKVPIQKYSDKRKVESIEQRITTISREVGKKISVDEIKKSMMKNFEDYFDIKLQSKPFVEEELSKIKKLEKSKYLTDEWIFQYSPQDDMTGMSLRKTPAGLLRTYIGLKGETIKSVLITGDFFEQSDIFNQIESKLKWSPLDQESISGVVSEVLAKQKGNKNSEIQKEDIVQSIWVAAQRALAAERYTYEGSCYYPEEKQISDNFKLTTDN